MSPVSSLVMSRMSLPQSACLSKSVGTVRTV